MKIKQRDSGQLVGDKTRVKRSRVAGGKLKQQTEIACRWTCIFDFQPVYARVPTSFLGFSIGHGIGNRESSITAAR